MSWSDVKYAWPCGVNVSNFVTVNPSMEGDERSDFKIWKEQMLCLLESQDVLGFVDGQILPPEDAGTETEQSEKKQWRRTDRLVKGWILGSIGKDALHAVWEKETARGVWLELDNIFSRKEAADADDGDQDNSGDSNKYLAVYQAAQRGDWDVARSFFQDTNELATAAISSYSETALHVAVLTGKANEFVKKLVESTAREALAQTDCYGDTALHNAAVVGNTEAAMALVNKNPDLLYILNEDDQLPVLQAALHCQKKTLKYLISKHHPNAVEHDPFEGKVGINLLISTISSEFLDVALVLAEKYPNLALLRDEHGDSALSTIAVTDSLFPRTETFSWWQKFIYHRIPVKLSKSEADAHTSVAGDIEDLSNDGATHKHYSASFHIISGGKLPYQFHFTIYISIYMCVCCRR